MNTCLRFCLPLVAALGCYDPSLGPHPFLCGPGAVCPDGYTCDPSNVCIKGSAVSSIDAPVIPHDGGSDDDAGHFGITCTPDTAPDRDLEPNDSPQQALAGESHLGSHVLCHPLDGGGCDPYGSYVKFAICTPGDADYYGIPLKNGDTIHVEVTFHVRVGDLDAAMVDSSGKLVLVSSGTGDNEIFNFTATADATYFLLVEGYRDNTNTYDLAITKTN
jgi:hypothetical protein